MHSSTAPARPGPLVLNLALEGALDLGDFIRASFLVQRLYGGDCGHALVTGIVCLSLSVDEGDTVFGAVACAETDPETKLSVLRLKSLEFLDQPDHVSLIVDNVRCLLGDLLGRVQRCWRR